MPGLQAKNLVGPPRTGDQHPVGYSSGWFHWNHRKPAFNRRHIWLMLHDPRVLFGLKMIKGPILARSRFYIQDPETRADGQWSPVKKFVAKQITHFWRNGAIKALKCVDWGYAGNEVMYRFQNNQVHYDALKLLNPNYIRVVSHCDAKVGISVSHSPRNVRGDVYLGGPKGLWTIHAREEHNWYGLSRLFGAFHPWYEMYTDGGARDVRRLYYHKYAFSGEVGRFKPGSTPDTNDPMNRESNKDIMRDVMEKRKTGGSVFFPAEYDEQGNPLWQIEPPTPGPGATDILQYWDSLRNEIWEGLGVPEEIVAAAETGSGYSGRRIPEESFFATLQEVVNWIIHDFDTQVIRPLVALNFGIMEPAYEIIPFGLLRGDVDEEERESQQRLGLPRDPGGEPEGAAPPQTQMSLESEPKVPIVKQRTAHQFLCV